MNSGLPAELKNIKNSLKYWNGFILQIWEEDYSEKQNKGSDLKNAAEKPSNFKYNRIVLFWPSVIRHARRDFEVKAEKRIKTRISSFKHLQVPRPTGEHVSLLQQEARASDGQVTCSRSADYKGSSSGIG